MSRRVGRGSPCTSMNAVDSLALRECLNFLDAANILMVQLAPACVATSLLAVGRRGPSNIGPSAQVVTALHVASLPAPPRFRRNQGFDDAPQHVAARRPKSQFCATL